MPRSPRVSRPYDQVDIQTISGIAVELRYDYKGRNVDVVPDETAIKYVSCHALLRFWTAMGVWSKRFCAANPDWTIDGERPEDRLLDSDLIPED